MGGDACGGAAADQLVRSPTWSGPTVIPRLGPIAAPPFGNPTGTARERDAPNDALWSRFGYST